MFLWILNHRFQFIVIFHQLRIWIIKENFVDSECDDIENGKYEFDKMYWELMKNQNLKINLVLFVFFGIMFLIKV